jgi:HPt (histidine-containing phosphotransfer) domain-containing protein
VQRVDDFPVVSALLDFRVVEDLSHVLDEATRHELLESFAKDVSDLIEGLRAARAEEAASLRHALMGVTSMIGAKALHDLVEGRAAQAEDLRRCLAQTVQALSMVFTSAATQEGQQRAG